jgi:hypothetical protein
MRPDLVNDGVPAAARNKQNNRLGSHHNEARLPVTAGPLPSLTAGRKCGATKLRVADGYRLDHQSPACVGVVALLRLVGFPKPTNSVTILNSVTTAKKINRRHCLY